MATKEKADNSEKPVTSIRRVVAQTFVSLDGVMQAPGGPEEDQDGWFRHGGWSMNYWDDAMGRLMEEFVSQPHEILLGRRTYEIFAAYWPLHRDGPVGASLNQSPKHVASRTLKTLEWENSRLLPGDVVAAVRDLKQRPGPPLHVLGSANLLQTLWKQDLVDELDLWVFPVVLGSGKRVFHDGAIPSAWNLTSSQATSTGVMILHYDRAGDITYGGPPGA